MWAAEEKRKDMGVEGAKTEECLRERGKATIIRCFSSDTF